MRSGAIEESVWQDFKAAENGMQREIYAVQAEAETFKPGWSEGILREAVELCRKEDALNLFLKEHKRQEKKDKKKNNIKNANDEGEEGDSSSNSSSSDDDN